MDLHPVVSHSDQGALKLVAQHGRRVGRAISPSRRDGKPGGAHQHGEAIQKLLPELQGQPLGCAFAHPWSLAQQLGVAFHDGAHQFFEPHRPQEGQPHLGAHPIDGHELAKQLPFMAALKAEKGPTILPNGVVHMQGDGIPGRGQLGPEPLAHLHLVSHALADDQQPTAVCLLPGILKLSLQPTNHGHPVYNQVCPPCQGARIASVRRESCTIVPSGPIRELPHPQARWGTRWLQEALHLAVLTVLLGSLTLGLGACTAASGPPQGTLLNALALQIQLTQADVARALSLESVGAPVVSRVRVEQQEPVTIGQGQGLRIAGRFDWRLGKDPFRVDAPFEIFLERGDRGESWRLARPSGQAPEGEQEWLTYPLPLRDSTS